MFGLMRAKKCGMADAEKHFRRLNYCGTCKTIGSLYGQKSRFLLNHDTVFLAEILSALSGEDVEDWQQSYQSYNCLNLPAGKMPKSLQFAATTNVILIEFKLADHIADESKKRHRFAQKAFSREFQKAERILENWNFPLAEVKKILQTQTARESRKSAKTVEESLNDFAEPTAQTTAIFFREGIRQIGANDSENLGFSLGFSFGKLIYLLDAFEDYEKDFRAAQFNAVRAAFDLKEGKIPAEAKRKIISTLRELENEIIEKLCALPIAERQKTLFIARLSGNLERKLKTNPPVVKTNRVCAPKAKFSFKRRWQTASEKAKVLAQNHSWQMPLVFLFIFVFALVAPAQSREAKSARECFDLSFNLMFLGAIFGAVLTFPKTLLMQTPEQIAAEEAKKKAVENGSGTLAEELSKPGSWCDICDCCCCCDCEDGCCDGCDCNCD